MTEGIVDLLEAIEIKKEKGADHPMVAGALRQTQQGRLEHAPVGEPGHHVDLRQEAGAVPQRLLGGDILLHAEYADGNAVLALHVGGQTHPALVAERGADAGVEREAAALADRPGAQPLHLRPRFGKIELDDPVAVDG